MARLPPDVIVHPALLFTWGLFGIQFSGLARSCSGKYHFHQMRIITVVVCFFVVLSQLLAVEKGPRPEPLTTDEQARILFWHGLDLHQKGVAGDENAVVEAQEIFEQILEEYPEDARVQAFLGNAYAMRARDAIFYKKMDWLKKGLQTLDSAVDSEPEDPHVRSVRAINSYQLPRIFGRRDVAEEDFQVLLEWAKNDPDRYTDGLLRLVYFHAGMFTSRQDEEKARTLYRKALGVPSDSVSEAEIKEALEDVY